MVELEMIDYYGAEPVHFRTLDHVSVSIQKYSSRPRPSSSHYPNDGSDTKTRMVRDIALCQCRITCDGNPTGKP